ncbi:MAG: polysaccharide deacetylase family protein [Bacteroidales bacterium]
MGTGNPGKHPRKNGRKGRMLLSFDDGLAECRQIVAPLLLEKGIPAVFFLNNDFLGNRTMFYRYKSSLLVNGMEANRARASNLLKQREWTQGSLRKLILQTRYADRQFLDELASEMDLNFHSYLKDNPIYMTEKEVGELADMGFALGAHSRDHREFFAMTASEMEEEVATSISSLRRDFRQPDPGLPFPSAAMVFPTV